MDPNHMPGLQCASCSMNIKLGGHFMSYIYFCIRWESEKRIQIEESGRTKKASNIGSSTVCDTLIFIFCSVGMKKKKGQKVC